ncbi:DNA polymerase I [Candidatus Rickettsiella viridis]|uniref:DNA polymerase I n=1 Tax=Candidatus Rickettsiella viridis TaxID=676208 RepID=A0A2Z5UTV4_9COXI|nr:DNA polymerase I [Candidatus Rickettsiella viridis]BBB15056.1 DNA polymerase I [Candidatus Rickettsiella viridis]
MKKPLILVDGTSYLYRAYHALPPLNNTKGEPTGAIYGVINMLRKLIKDYQPDHIGIVFDAKGKTFREDLYTAYKANRATMPEELQQQIEPLYAIVDSLGLPRLILEGVEADDVIASLAEKAIQQHLPVLISTGDKDFAQLVNPHITLVNTMTNTVLDREGVIKKFGVTPEQITDYLSLVGDAVDNVPGIPNVGPKTAAKWLNQYGDLATLIKNAADISGKVGENLRAHLDQLPLSRQLVTIKKDIELNVDIEDLRPKAADTAELMRWYKQLEFKGWIKELEKTTPPIEEENTATKNTDSQQWDFQQVPRNCELSGNTAENSSAKNIPKKNYPIILDEPSLDHWIKQLETASEWALDTETTSLDAMNAELVGLSFAIKPGKAVYIPLAHDYLDAPKQLDRNLVLKKLKPLLENPKQLKIGHNLKYDMSVLANYGIQLQGLAFDTMLESYLLDSASNQHSLDNAALKYLDYKTIHFVDIAGKGAKQKTFNQIDLTTAGEYAAEDSDIALQLHQTLWPQLTQTPPLATVLTTLEMPLVSVLSRIERYGVLIDAALLKKQSVSLAKRLLILEKKAYDLAGKTFNLSSPKQLQTILFIEQGLPIVEKTPTGQASTSESVLQSLALEYPLANVILKHRSLSKLKSTYTDKLPLQINPKTGRVHTSYHQAAVSTGRLSSSDPNLQNIPARTEEGRKIRQAFIAAPGYRIISADYSQIELRIIAHFSQDKGLLDAFAQGLDIHQATAAEVLKIPLEKVTSEQRRSAKAVNFGLVYGMSAFGLARQLGIGREEAKQYIDRYFMRYPGVKNYMERTRQQAKQQGYVTTLLGRRLNLPRINASDPLQRKASERAAINAPLQGSAADIIKKAMIDVDHAFLSQGIDARMIMQVHDELVVEAAISCQAKAKQLLEEHMVNVVKLRVPLIVDIHTGHNWAESP